MLHLTLCDSTSDYFASIMTKAEWRLFIPNDEGTALTADAKALMDLLDGVEASSRTDIYLRADADVGVKRRVSSTNIGATSKQCCGVTAPAQHPNVASCGGGQEAQASHSLIDWLRAR